MNLLPAGSKIDRFQIASAVGRGAMGVVDLAHVAPNAGKDLRP